MNVPFLDLQQLHEPLREALEAASRRVLRSGWYILGPELEAFEAEFAEYCGAKHCVGVGNGLDALHLTLRAYGIGPGDEVLVPSNTFIATWLAVTQCGAVPVPVEPDPSTHNIDPLRIPEAVTNRTRAVIPVHLYGLPADMDRINAVASQHNLIVIEDAAQAQGARYHNRRTGSLGHAAATSFYPGKNLGALGDGGAVLTSDDSIADKVRQLRNYGSSAKYQHDLAGYNSRLDEFQAALLREKLRVLDAWNDRRRAIAAEFTKRLSAAEVTLPHTPDDVEPVWHLYVVRSPWRNELQDHLQTVGVSTIIHYPTPPHQQRCYRDDDYGGLPIAERLAAEVLSLPLSPALTQQEIDAVVHGVNGFSITRARTAA